jgi:hypothetical protein
LAGFVLREPANFFVYFRETRSKLITCLSLFYAVRSLRKLEDFVEGYFHCRSITLHNVSYGKF